MTTEWTWTSDQQKALVALRELISGSESKAHTLTGMAGSGKTTLTKEFVKMARQSGKQVLAVAPTHKARRVMHQILNNRSIMRTPTITVASLLGKSRGHSYIGTHNYIVEQDHKMNLADVIIIDEVSMLTHDDYTMILGLAMKLKKKILFIGDDAQIPNPSQKMVKTAVNGVECYIKDPVRAFTDIPCSRLSQVMRQDETSDLYKLCQRIHDTIGQELLFDTDISRGIPCYDSVGFLEEIKRGFNIKDLSVDDLAHNRVITYTNAGVHAYNKFIRDVRSLKGVLSVGDLLTGYNNVGIHNDYIVENGQDYLITGIETVKSVINGYDAYGTAVTMMEPSSPLTARTVFFMDVYDDRNIGLLEKLVELADRVNQPKSGKLDFKNYICLKNQIIFRESIYRFKNNIITHSEFQAEHPLLFTNTCDAMADSREINEKYPGLLEKRRSDNKSLSSSEVLADMFQILEKDIDYGFAVTAHKSQGSTYLSAYVDVLSFSKLRDSTYKGIPVNRAIERDQLRYVAISRAKSNLYLLMADRYDRNQTSVAP